MTASFQMSIYERFAPYEPFLAAVIAIAYAGNSGVFPTPPCGQPPIMGINDSAPMMSFGGRAEWSERNRTKY
jgi:hypothetical protein